MTFSLLIQFAFPSSFGYIIYLLMKAMLASCFQHLKIYCYIKVVNMIYGLDPYFNFSSIL